MNKETIRPLQKRKTRIQVREIMHKKYYFLFTIVT